MIKLVKTLAAIIQTELRRPSHTKRRIRQIDGIYWVVANQQFQILFSNIYALKNIINITV